jgi:flavin-dependent dehydrogenase
LPRSKVCAGGLVKRAYRQLPKGLVFPIQATCHQLESRAMESDIHLVEHEADLIHMVDRHHFDHALVQHATGLGAELWQETTAHAVQECPGGVVLETSAGNVRANYVILAEGAHSQIANRIWGRQPHSIPALEIDVYAPQEVLDAYRGRAIFDLEAIAQGYGWIFYKGDHLSVGVTSYHPGKVDVRGALKAYLARCDLDQPALQRNRRGFIIPVLPRKNLVRNRVILVGDTAGFADPISAEGLSYAIISGGAAAQAIALHGDHPWRVAAHYQRLIRTPILDELASARRLAWVLYRTPRLRNFLLRRLGRQCQKAMRLVISGQRRFAELASIRRIARHLVSGG